LSDHGLSKNLHDAASALLGGLALPLRTLCSVLDLSQTGKRWRR
jgi:hypothetical protein